MDRTWLSSSIVVTPTWWCQYSHLVLFRLKPLLNSLLKCMGSYTALQMKGRWESNINVLFGISYSLSNQIGNWLKGLLVSIYDPYFFKWEICMLVIYVHSQLNPLSGGEGRKLPPTSAWWQFPTPIRLIMRIYKSLPNAKLGKRSCSLISENICFEFSVQCRATKF